jgi:peptide/nickel transport system permease protein
MLNYIIRRIFLMIVTIFLISIITFIIIQLPPGDILTSKMQQLQAEGQEVSLEVIETYRVRYGLDKPMYVQYFMWIGNFLKGNMGWSFAQNKPVNELVWDRIGYTVLLSFLAMIFTWVVALPIGIYSAVERYTIWDYILTFLGFIGIATPAFMLALVVMYLAFEYWGISVSGLFSPEYASAVWSWAKFVDLLKHAWIPIVIIGLNGTAASIRVLRANLIDELEKPYVRTARAKGVGPVKLLLKYPVRIALSPFISTVGWTLPYLFSGAAIISIVLSLPMIGPILLGSLMSQDMFIAASILLITSSLTVVGTLISDILLAISDPRIRYE